MLQIQEKNTFKRRVHANEPSSENANVAKPVTFVAEFKFIEREEVDQLQADIEDGEVGNAEVVDMYLVGLEEIIDTEKNPVPYDTARTYILSRTHLTAATAKSFLEGLYGARAGNSRKQRKR